MISMNSYLNTYVDRRMQAVVDEWELSTRADLSDLVRRLDALEKEIPLRQAFEKTAGDRLTSLEARAKKLKGRT